MQNLLIFRGGINMLSNEELSTLRALRVRLLHYWVKFPDVSLDKKSLDNCQNVLDKIILREQKRVQIIGGQDEKV